MDSIQSLNIGRIEVASIAKWYKWWPLLYGGLVTGVAFAAFSHWAYDDPFITYRYAANLLAGNGFVYNPGLRVLSTTTPLYTLLLALLGMVWPDLPTLSNFVSAASLALGGLFLWQLAQVWKTVPAGGTALLLYPTFPLLCSTFGGEMPFYTMLGLGTFAWYVQRRYILAALFGGLALLTRADAGVVLVLLAAHHLLCRREPVPWPALALFALITLPWFAFACWYFGSPLPATLTVKQHQAQMAISQSFAEGFVTTMVRNYGRLWVYRVEAALAATGVMYALARRREWTLFLAWPVLYFVAYTVLGVSRYFWYYAPLVPGFVAAVGLGATACAGGIRRILQRPRWAQAVVLVGLLALTTQQGWGVWRLRQHPDRRVAIYQAVGEWLRENIPPQATVGTLEVGIIGYYAQRPMVDFAGLIQPHVARQLRRDTTYEDAALWATAHYRPDYLVLNPAWFPHLMEQYVTPFCRPAQTFEGKAYRYEGELVIYVCSRDVHR